MRRLLAAATLLLTACALITGASDLEVGEAPPVSVPDRPPETGAPDDDAAGPADATVVDVAPPPFDPLAIVAPYRDGGLVYPESIKWTLATVDGGTIRYTTDGTIPGAGSPSAKDVVRLPKLPNGTVVKWSVAGSDVVHSFTVRIDADAASDYGTMFANVDLGDSGSPLLVVRSDAGTIGGTASLRIWNQPACPGCLDALVVGIGAPSDCYIDAAPGAYPGQTDSVAFSVDVPTTPGVYGIRGGLAQVFTCSTAASQPWPASQIGVLVVTP